MYSTHADNTEPMMLGSPSHSSPPHSQFLPPYLLGDSLNFSASKVTPGGSPPRSRLLRNISNVDATRQHDILSATSSFTSSPATESFLQRSLVAPQERRDRPGAPPTSRLLDSLNSSAVQSPTFVKRGDHSFVNSVVNITQMSQASEKSPDSFLPKKTPPSPAQRDPFFTQGENLHSDDVIDETWITVFGFRPESGGFILRQFSQYGTIVKHVFAPEGNWLHIRYQTKLQAKKALSKNGKVFGSSIMVGVQSCIDKTVIQQSAMPPPPSIGPGDGPSHCNINRSSSFMSPLNGRGRPLVHRDARPQKRNGLLTRAMEYVFGW